LSNLIINGTTGIDTFNVTSTASGPSSTATTINADAGLDLFGNIPLNTIAGSGLTINAGGNGEALNLDVVVGGLVNISSTQVRLIGHSAVNYFGFASLVVNGTPGFEDFTIDSTAANTATTINGNGGGDVFSAPVRSRMPPAPDK
jgi:hypothetical protein